MRAGEWTVAGINPEPWTSPEVSIGRRGGKMVPIVYKRERVRAFQEALHDYIRDECEKPELLSGELELSLYFWRQLEAPNSKRVDATNLQKSTEDALHGLLFDNDSQVRRVHSTIVEQSVGIHPLIVIVWQPWQDQPDIDHWRKKYPTLVEDSTAPPPSNERHVPDIF
jgi:Holliday junction resolvase RusA-like endonuclease